MTDALDLAPLDYVIYDPATGEITEHGNLPLTSIAKRGGEWALGFGRMGTHYIDIGKPLAERVPLLRLVGMARLRGTKLDLLPDPCRLVINGAEHPTPITGGVADLSFDHPDTYTVEVRSVPYLPKTFQVTRP